MMTTGSGVTAQRLQEAVLRPAGVSPAGAGPPATLATSIAAALPGGFMRDLVTARPDLARKLGTWEARPRTTADTLIYDRPTLFLFGYAWKSTSEWIGSYGDL